MQVCVCVLIFTLLSFKSVVVGKGGVCICGGMCILVQVSVGSRGSRRKCQIPGTGITDSCGPLKIDAGNRIHDFSH